MDAQQRQVVGCVTPVISLQKLKDFFVQPKFRSIVPYGPASSLEESRTAAALEASHLHNLYGNHSNRNANNSSPPVSSSSSSSMLVVPQPVSAASKSPGGALNASNTTANGTGRKYQCKMCPQIFLHKSGMQHHAREIHRGELKPHQCQQCLKSFSSNHQLTQHIRIHTGEKPYKCSYCERRFKQLSHVQQHTRLHTGERPYKCHVQDCGRAFIQLSNLQQHLRNHDTQMERAKTRPFHCNICGKGFATESSLRTHRAKQHAALVGGANSQSCPICHKICVSGEALMEHMRLAHKDPNASGTPSKRKRGRSSRNLLASLSAAAASTSAIRVQPPPPRPPPPSSCPPDCSSCGSPPSSPSSAGMSPPSAARVAYSAGSSLLASMGMSHFMMPAVMGGALTGNPVSSNAYPHPLAHARAQSSFLAL